MKTLLFMSHVKRLNQALTAWELLVVISIFAVGAGMLLPALRRTGHHHCRINCVSNLKQIGTGFRMYGNDNDGQLPQFDVTNQAWQYFQAAGDQLSSPKVLLCPNDNERPKASRPALDFVVPSTTNSFGHPNHQNNSLSYFYGVDVSLTNSGLILAGDRNLALNDHLVVRMARLKSSRDISWTTAMHNKMGNLVFPDGSVLPVDAAGLRKAISAGTNETQRLIFP